MRNRIGVLAWALVLAGCAAPTPTVPAPLLITTPVVALTITGLPESLTYGQSAQLAALATLPDGNQKAAIVAWRSSNAAIVNVSEEGLLRVGGFGDAAITATLRDVQQVAHVVVPVPPPPVARLRMKIDDHGSTLALADATAVTFDLSASTGTALTYDIKFGDGESALGKTTVSHVYRQARFPYFPDFRIDATVTDPIGRTDSVSQTLTVVSLSGTEGYWSTQDRSPRLFIDFGRAYFSRQTYFGETYAFSYVVSSANDIRIVLSNGEVFEGPLRLSDIDHRPGSYFYDRRMQLRVHGGVDDGKSEEFRYAERY